LKKRPQIEFNLSSALLEAVYREGKRLEKMSQKSQGKIRGQESDEIGSIS
jgi:hypothetical protein